MSSPAPIILFIYNREAHTRKTLEAIAANELAAESALFVFADGPKQNAGKEDLEKITAARNVLREKKWCKEIHITERETNMQLEDNVIDGISSVINKFGKAIILEDDLVVSPFFLKYCNDGLEMYKEDKRVYSINGYMFPIDFGTKAATFLCPLATSSWGWATWTDRWQHYEHQPKSIDEIEQNKTLRDRFNFGGYDYFTMLKFLNTWDVRWYYTAFIRNGMGVFPTKSLVKNIGFDGSGTHDSNSINGDLYTLAVDLQKQTSINTHHFSLLDKYYRKHLGNSQREQATSISHSLPGKVKKLVRKITRHIK